MAIETVPFTQAGYDRLQAQLENLKFVEKPQVIEEIAEARGHGDLKENAEYHAAREKQGIIEARIRELEDQLTRGVVITNDGDQDNNRVRFGAKVHLEEEESGEERIYQIVGDLEADIKNHSISISSPLAKALLGKKIDDLVQVRLPKGEFEYVVTGIQYP